jgi:hypothetical protein
VEPFDIALIRGDSWSAIKVRWLDVDGNPVTLASARMQIRPSTGSSEVLLELTSDDGITIDDDQYAIPAITPEQSADLRSGTYDLEVTSESAEVRTLVGGDVEVHQDVSR